MFSKFLSHRRRSLMTWVILMTLMATSCGIFEPRESEEPDQIVGGSEYEPAQEPEAVVRNLIKVIQGLDSVNYRDLFSEDFGFVPDPEDVQFMDNHYGPGVYLDWNENVETTVTERMFDRINSARLAFTDTTVAVDTDSAYVVYHGYLLQILPKYGGWTPYEGIAHFHMRKDPSDNLWYIYRWDDFRLEGASDNENATWGLLKGEIRATT
jgi:hypothetical protein